MSSFSARLSTNSLRKTRTYRSAMAGVLSRTRQQCASSARRISVLTGHLGNIFASNNHGAGKEERSTNNSLPLLLACGSGAVGASAAAFSSQVNKKNYFMSNTIMSI